MFLKNMIKVWENIQKIVKGIHESPFDLQNVQVNFEIFMTNILTIDLLCNFEKRILKVSSVTC